MKVLVTGCAGFIGFHVLKKLAATKNMIVGIDNMDKYYDTKLKKDRIDLIKKIIPKNKFIFIKGDILNKNLVNSLIKKYKIKKIIHLAAQAGVRHSISNPRKYIDANIIGFFNILEISRDNKISHLIYASTSSVYGSNKNYPFVEKKSADHPIQLYAATKRSNEIMAHSYSSMFKIPTTGLRFFTAYGPFGRPDMALYLFAKNISQNKKINVFNNGNHTRDFTYVDDIADAVVKIFKVGFKKEKNWNNKNPDIGSSGAPFTVLNIGSGKKIKLMKYIKLIEKEIGKKSNKKYLSLQKGDIQKTQANINKLKNLYKFNCSTPVEIGIKRYIKWFKQYYKY